MRDYGLRFLLATVLRTPILCQTRWRATMDVEGNIQYLTGETTDDACPAEQYDGPDTDGEDPDVANVPRGPVTG
jgi:hypothetical protein